jgi:glutaconate CoA-transferase subunit B
VSREQVEDNTGFRLAFEARLETIEPPRQQELAVLRELDPQRLYTA